MKTLHLFLAVLISSVLFTSCNKDDVNVNSEDPLIGEWDMTSLYFEGQTTMNIPSVGVVEVVATAVATNMDYQFVFSKNGEYTSKGSYSVQYTMTAQGYPAMVQTFEGNNLTGSGTWELTDTSIVLTDEQGVALEMSLVELTSKDLELSISPSSFIGDIPLDISEDSQGTLKFKK